MLNGSGRHWKQLLFLLSLYPKCLPTLGTLCPHAISALVQQLGPSEQTAFLVERLTEEQLLSMNTDVGTPAVTTATCSADMLDHLGPLSLSFPLSQALDQVIQLSAESGRGQRTDKFCRSLWQHKHPLSRKVMWVGLCTVTTPIYYKGVVSCFTPSEVGVV